MSVAFVTVHWPNPSLKTARKEFFSEATVSDFTLDVKGCFVEIASTTSASAI
jgi:hypothetical protein